MALFGNLIKSGFDLAQKKAELAEQGKEQQAFLEEKAKEQVEDLKEKQKEKLEDLEFNRYSKRIDAMVSIYNNTLTVSVDLATKLRDSESKDTTNIRDNLMKIGTDAEDANSKALNNKSSQMVMLEKGCGGDKDKISELYRKHSADIDDVATKWDHYYSVDLKNLFIDELKKADLRIDEITDFSQKLMDQLQETSKKLGDFIKEDKDAKIEGKENIGKFGAGIPIPEPSK